MDLIEYKALIIFVWLLTLFLLEQFSPKVTPVGGKARIFKNYVLLIISILVSVTIVLPVTKLSLFYPLFEMSWRPDWSKNILFDIIILDIFIYWWHRANHEIDFLWRFHQVHHLDEFLDTSSAFRFHFGEIILSSFARLSIIILFAIPISSVLIFETFVLLCALFHHSNIRVPKRLEHFLDYLIITPSRHWVHHNLVKDNLNSNYGTIFIFWDKIFRTLNPLLRMMDMKMGIKNEKDTDLIGLISRPFIQNKKDK